MTPYSFQSVPVPDRYISRLRHSQSGTRGKGVKDLSLRAIQISCTLFHPFHCLSLPLFSFWMSVSFFFFIYISPSFVSLPLQVPASVFYSLLTLSIFPLSISLSHHPTIPTFMFFFFPTLHIFPSLPMWDFLSRAHSISGTEGVCVWLHVVQPCVPRSHLTVGSIQNNIQQWGNFISRSVVQGSALIHTHFPSL